MSELSDIVIVGASLAGLRAAETLRAEGYAGRLTIVGRELHLPYDRPPLSKELLTGAIARPALDLPHPEGLDATWRLGSSATALDLQTRAIQLADGSSVSFDGLVLATGSGARELPVFAHGGPTVHTLRTADDALRLRPALTPASRLLIVGLGFIGVEVAASARMLGVEVTAVGLEPPLAPAGPLASAAASRLLEENGVRVLVGHGIEAVGVTGPGSSDAGAAAPSAPGKTGSGSASDAGAAAPSAPGPFTVVLTDGARIEADHVVVAVGSVPHVAWLEGSGLELADGLVCDATLHAVGAENVVAAGDIVRWPNATYGGVQMRVEHWSNAVEQGAHAARSLLLGAHAQPFGAVPSFWSDHFGVRLQSVGVPRLADRFEVVAGSTDERRWAAEAYAGDTLVGAVAYGMPRALVPVKARLMRAGVALEAARR